MEFSEGDDNEDRIVQRDLSDSRDTSPFDVSLNVIPQLESTAARLVVWRYPVAEYS